MLDLLYPHLGGLVRFTDFQQTKAQGSAGSLANTVRTFVAEGVTNRVLALADNDTAGHEAMQVLKTMQLPDNVRIAHLPTLPSLQKYPTLGPQSRLTQFDWSACHAIFETILSAFE
jgi:hypothetical protein